MREKEVFAESQNVRPALTPPELAEILWLSKIVRYNLFVSEVASDDALKRRR